MGCAVPLLASILTAASPGPTTFRDVAHKAEPALVQVRCGKKLAPGVVVGGQGAVLTASRACPCEQPEIVRADGSTVNGVRTRSDDSLGLALVELPAGSYVAVGAAKQAPKPESWVVAVGRSAKGTVPAAGLWHAAEPKAPTQPLADTPAATGAPLFDLNGKLVGIVVGQASNHRVRVAPVEAIRGWLSADGGDAP